MSAITEVAIALRSQNPVKTMSDTETNTNATSERMALTLVSVVLGSPIEPDRNYCPGQCPGLWRQAAC